MHPCRSLLGHARRQRSLFLLIFLVTIAASALVALQPWPMKLLVDHVLEGKPLPNWLSSLAQSFHVSATNHSLLVIVVIGGLLLFVTSSLLDAALTWAWTVAG